MFTYRTYFRCRNSDYHMTAVTALPHDDPALLKYFHGLDIFQKRAVSFLMHFFDRRNIAELSSKLIKSFLFSLSGHSFIHIRPFCIFSLCRMKQILRGVAQFAKRLEPELSVLFVKLT